MRIGINASFLRKPATGIGQVTTHFLEELSKMIDASDEAQSIEYILYLEEDLTQDISLSEKMRIKSFLPFLWRRDDLVRKILWEKFLLPKQAQEDGCDVLLSLYQSATIVPEGMWHIMVVHDIIPKLFSEYLDNARKRMYQSLIEKAILRADDIVAVSSHTKKDLVSHLNIPSEKISVNHIDVDPLFKKEVSKEKSSEVMEKYRLQSGYIYTGGGLEKRKNVEKTLRAYGRLADQAKENGLLESFPELVISGKLMPQLAPLITDVKKLAGELNLSDRVKILGFVPQEDLPVLYANASVFAFPSLYEGFGLPVLEAMNQGAIVVTSRTTSLPEVGDDAVVYCDPKSVDSIAGALYKALSDDVLRKTLLVREKEAVKKFSWENFTRAMVKMFRQ